MQGKRESLNYGVHTKDIYEHVSTKLNNLSKTLETEKILREKNDSLKIIGEENIKLAEFEEVHQKAKKLHPGESSHHDTEPKETFFVNCSFYENFLAHLIAHAAL